MKLEPVRRQMSWDGSWLCGQWCELGRGEDNNFVKLLKVEDTE
jgi:hypothetical protein